MTKYIVVNGHPRSSGKSLFATLVRDELELRGFFTFQYSSVAMVKELALRAGWNGSKTPEARKFLSDLKRLLVNSPWGNLSMRDVHEYAKKKESLFPNETIYVFVMVREPEEIQQYVERLGATAVFVRRPNADVPMGNDSDDGVENFSYHYYINNDGTVEDLTTRAEEFTNWLLRYV